MTYDFSLAIHAITAESDNFARSRQRRIWQGDAVNSSFSQPLPQKWPGSLASARWPARYAVIPRNGLHFFCGGETIFKEARCSRWAN